MQVRRFGRTELAMPVLTGGGMRYQQFWKDLDAPDILEEKQATLEACVRYAFRNGMNHVETARGYGSSEIQLGLVLPSLPRAELIVQTKIPPKENEDAFRRTFETSLSNLKLDYVDLLGVHGLNTRELVDQTLHGGTLAACRKLQAEGLVRHVGFSTHGYTDTIRYAIETGEFSYVNLHWYYFDQRNWPAIAAARRHDMGVFIISPNDKGGMLYEPPARLVDLCAPLSPMGFNDLFCLSHPEVHTLSIGAAKPSDYDAHLAILPRLDRAASTVAPVAARLRAALVEAVGADWADHWQDGLPAVVNVPDEIPLYHILRLHTLARAFGMLAFGRMRYNLLGNGGHWFPGCKAGNVDPKRLRDALGDYRFADRVPELLREAHAMFNAEDRKRLSESA